MSARKQAEEALVLALASGATVEDAARQGGLSEVAVRRKLASPPTGSRCKRPTCLEP